MYQPKSFLPVMKTLADATIRLASRHKTYDPKQTVSLLGTPRGGTTILAQIVNQIPRTQVLWEPLRPNNNRECQQAGFGWHHILDESDHDPKQYAYMRNLLSGEAIHWGTLYRKLFNPIDFLRSNRLIVKFVNANRILRWLSHNFPNPIVFMVRSPFAVVASQLRHGGFQHSANGSLDNCKRDWIEERLVREYPAVPTVYERVDSVEEALAWNWCVDMLFALQDIPESVFVMTYEELICYPERTLSELFKYLELPLPHGAIDMLRSPSSTASDGVEVAKPRQQIIRYKNRLSSTQIKNIERIIQEFGLHFYLDNDLPTHSEVEVSDGSIPRSRCHGKPTALQTVA